MTGVHLDHAAAGVAIRDDVRVSHERIVDHLRRPGSWFTGAEKLAIAAESRHAADCPLCTARAASLSPDHPQGEHGRVSALPDAVVEIAHRVRRDPQRLSRSWHERMLASGLEVGAYVEAVGVVAFVAGLDAFCRAVGLSPFALPEPLPGAPSRHVPANLRPGIAWVPILAPEDASGPEADLYEGGGFVPNIARALSLVPGHVRVLQEESASHYVKMSDIGNPGLGRDLDRLQIELVAARVSALNECFY